MQEGRISCQKAQLVPEGPEGSAQWWWVGLWELWAGHQKLWTESQIMSGASLAMGLDSGMVDRSSRMGGGFWVGQVTGLPPAVEGRVGGLMPWAGCSQAGFGCTSRQGVTFWSHILAGMEMRNLQRWD